jgi:hypothetical protein
MAGVIPPTPGQQWPAPPSSGQQPGPPERPERPEDVITGFWLWAAAVPLLVAAYLISVVTSPTGVPIIIVFSVMFMVVLVAIVVTFLVLMRTGYRWARTVLTAGGLSSIFYVALNLFTTERSTFGAVGYAVTGIIGAVLVGGGIYLLHRPDAHGYLTR